jgi:hypothetical protein
LSKGAILAFRGKPDRYSNLTIKEIPKAVLSRCEWGKDDYSSRVENLSEGSAAKRADGVVICGRRWNAK